MNPAKVFFRSRRPAWSRGKYALFMIGLWAYTLAWAIALIVIDFVLPINMVVKGLITIVLIVLTPTGGYFTSYQKYREWHAEHVVVESGSK